jgi:hypothetical protein
MTEQVYAVVRDDDGQLDMVEGWPRTMEGAIVAATRAARLSAGGVPHEVRRPDGRMLGRWVRGRRADLPPGGIIHLADARAAGMAEVVNKIAGHM